MKHFILRIIFIATIGLISCSLWAQKRTDNVPQAVVTAFSVAYPHAKLKNWKINKDTCVALFKWEDRKCQVYYSKTGDWIRTESNFRHKTSLPEDAQLFLKTGKYASWHIDELKNLKTLTQSLFLVSIDNNSGNPVSYSDNGSVENKMLYFDDKGKLVKVIDVE